MGLRTEGSRSFGPLSSLTFPGSGIRRGWGLRDAQEGSATLTGCVMPAGMRILVTLLLDTLPMLGNVLLLCFFVFFIFGIIGVQLWAGLLRNRCFLEENFTM